MQTIVPYLTVKGASEASAFYQKAFDAKENARHPAEDGKRLMHVALSVHGGDVFLCDEFPEHGGAPAPTKERPAPVQLTIQNHVRRRFVNWMKFGVCENITAITSDVIGKLPAYDAGVNALVPDFEGRADPGRIEPLFGERRNGNFAAFDPETLPPF